MGCVCPGPAGECRLSWPLSKEGSPLRRPERRWCARGGRAGKPPPCCAASSLPFPRLDSHRSGLDREDARVSRGHHVPMSPGTCLLPAAGLVTSPPVPRVPGRWEAAHLSRLLRHGVVCPCLQHAHTWGSTGSICVPALCPSLSRSKGRLGILQLVSFTLKRSHFRALILHFPAGFQSLLFKMPPCPLLFICFTPGTCCSSLGRWWGVTNGEWVLRTWAGSAAVPWAGWWFWVVPS